jgi:hypothetical protein
LKLRDHVFDQQSKSHCLTIAILGTLPPRRRVDGEGSLRNTPARCQRSQVGANDPFSPRGFPRKSFGWILPE